MWITKRSNGNYQFKDRYKDPLTLKWRTVSVTFGKNNAQVRKKAQLLLDEKINSKLNDLEAGSTNITLGELKKKYCDFAKNILAHSTYYRKMNMLNIIEKDLGSNIVLKNVKSSLLNKYFDNILYSKNLTNGTVLAYKTVLSTLYEFGVKYGYLAHNVVKECNISLKNERDRRINEIENKYLTDDEFLKIIEYCNDRRRYDVKDYLYWLYYTGMRAGEASTLQKKNIYQNIDGKWVAQVNGTLEIHNNSSKQKMVKSSSAKTIAGNREIILPQEAVKIALRHMENISQNDYLFIDLFPSSNGFFTPCVVDHMLKTACRKKGIAKNVTTHFFRHTHVSRLAELGVPLYVIQKRLGHESSKTTERIYLHVTSHAKNQLAEKLNDLAPNLRPKGKNKENNNLRAL